MKKDEFRRGFHYYHSKGGKLHLTWAGFVYLSKPFEEEKHKRRLKKLCKQLFARPKHLTKHAV